MSQSQYSQQELDLDTWWLQTGWEGSDVLGSADAYAPSLSNWLVEANQGGDTIQSPEAGYHDGEPANDGSIGSGYPQSGGGLASVAFDNSTQAGSMVWQIQDWSQRHDMELDHFMRIFEQDMGSQDDRLNSSHEPSLRRTSFSEFAGSGYLNNQDSHLNDQGSSLQTSDADDQVSQKCETFIHFDWQQGPPDVRKKYNIDSVAPKQRRADYFAACGRPPKRCILRQQNGAAFPDTNGKFVSALVMPGIRNVAAFIGCHGSTIRRAMAQTNEHKGIVDGIWRVEEYKEIETVNDEGLLIQHEEQSHLGQQTHQDSVVSALNYCCIYRPETTLSDVHTGLNAAGGHGQNISLVSPSVGQSSYLSVDPIQHLTAAGEQASGAAIVGSGYMIEYPKGSLKRGAPAKLYLLRRADGQHFNYEEKPVPFALICMDRDVRNVTGISRDSLYCAQQNADILWDPWKVTYLKKVHHRHRSTEQLLREIETLSALSSQLESLFQHPWQEYIRKNSLVLPMQRSNSGSANQHETSKSSHQARSTVLLSLEDSLISNNSINPGIGHQPSDLEGTIGSREQAVFHTKKGQAAFCSVATRKKMQKNAINHHQSISDAAKARIAEIHEKLLHVERVDGASFSYNKQQVYFAIIQGRLAASKLLNCHPKTIRNALQKRCKKKGIVKKIWRVKDLGKVIPSA
jgi:hypothetical protein